MCMYIWMPTGKLRAALLNPSPGDRSPGTELEEGRHEPLDVVPGEDLEPFAVGKKRKK